MTDQQRSHTTREADATTVAGTSQDPDLEADPRIPEGARENVEKAMSEAAAGEGVVDTVKRVGREVDRTFGGEYEAREDRAAADQARAERR